MFDTDINPFRHWISSLILMGLIAFLGLFRRWVKWPQCPNEVLGRATQILLLAFVIFAATVIGIVSVNQWLIEQPIWQRWMHDSEGMIPVAMLVHFLVALVALAFGVEHILRRVHPGCSVHIEEQALWTPRPQ